MIRRQAGFNAVEGPLVITVVAGLAISTRRRDLIGSMALEFRDD